MSPKSELSVPNYWISSKIRLRIYSTSLIASQKRPVSLTFVNWYTSTPSSLTLNVAALMNRSGLQISLNVSPYRLTSSSKPAKLSSCQRSLKYKPASNSYHGKSWTFFFVKLIFHKHSKFAILLLLLPTLCCHKCLIVFLNC